MPELPEVETIANHLKATPILNASITQLHVFWQKTFSSRPEDVVGKKISDVKRRGKYLILVLEPKGFLVIHLRMSGQLLIKKSHETRNKHEHVIFECDSQLSLRFHDTRKFGRIQYTLEPDLCFKALGPEALSISYEELKQKLDSSKKSIKSFLLDQSQLAGLGNIYTDEALFLSKIFPGTPTATLSQQTILDLHIAIQNVLHKGIKFGGTSLGSGKGNYSHINGESGKHQNHLNVYGKQGKPCPQCHTAIHKITIAQRGTHFCPNCQQIPQPLL